MQPISAGSMLLVIWIDRNAGGCKDPADGMSGDSTETGSFVWWSDIVGDCCSNLPDSELEKSIQDGCSVEHSHGQQDAAVVVASSHPCITFLCLLRACWKAVLCVWWWISNNHALMLALSSSWAGCTASERSPLGRSTNTSDHRKHACP